MVAFQVIKQKVGAFNSGLLNKNEILARQYFQAFYKRSDARLWHLEAQNPCTLLEKCEVKLETDL
jgi:hypothetical protein